MNDREQLSLAPGEESLTLELSRDFFLRRRFSSARHGKAVVQPGFFHPVLPLKYAFKGEENEPKIMTG